MSDPKRLRAQAVNILALALRIRDDEPYASYLIERVEELQAQATAIEAAAKPPPVEDEE